MPSTNYRRDLLLALVIWAAWASNATCAESWPSLPGENGTFAVPAQEWPREPGPREVKAYVYYPGGKLDGVTARTGLMLSLHNWGGTHAIGAPEPQQLADRFDVVAICVDYLQSGPWKQGGAPYDTGYLQALDALRALYAVHSGLEKLDKPFDRGRIFSTGGSGGGNVTLMVNKLAPRTFTCIIDLCGMAKLSDDIAFGIPGRTSLNAGYSQDAASPNYLRKDDQEIRFVGNPAHLEVMKRLGNRAKIVIVHGVDDASCPVDDAQEMAANMQAAGLDVEPHFVTAADVDGEAVKTTGHALGDRTRIVFRFAAQHLTPDSPQALVRSTPSDFERRDEVRYPTAGGSFVISYENGYPVGWFEGSTPGKHGGQ
jgi:predicted esterase